MTGDPGGDRADVIARFRPVLGLFPTGVTVVTAVCEGEPVGLAVSSFTSVSLDPPLVSFCVSLQSTTWPRIRNPSRFCVNVLGEQQEAISRTFAARGADRFGGLGWRPAPSGAPILDGVVAWMDGVVEREVVAGDHVIVVGLVTALGSEGDGAPLVFHRGRYGRLAP